jgi:hypothetical protein
MDDYKVQYYVVCHNKQQAADLLNRFVEFMSSDNSHLHVDKKINEVSLTLFSIRFVTREETDRNHVLTGVDPDYIKYAETFSKSLDRAWLKKEKKNDQN